MGVITPLGDTVEDLYQSQIEGRSGVGPITRFNATRMPTSFAAEVKNFDLGRYIAKPDLWEDAGLNSQFAAAAAQRALTDSGLLSDKNIDRSRFGVYLGTGEGAQSFHALVSSLGEAYLPEARKLDDLVLTRNLLQRYTVGAEREQELHTSPAHIAEHFGLEGPNYNCLTACAAGSQAIGEAREVIRYGEADIMLSGGSHSMVHPLGVTGFNLLTALSTDNEQPTKASRPFDMRREGFVIGEGAAVLILEELEHARARSATIHAELTGYGSTADAYRITDSHPDGRGAAACMQAALDDAGLKPADVGYINAHGTSTQVNDRSETIAIKKVFGEQAYKIPISSSKSMLGHLIGAAGAVELVISIMAIRRGILPPTINYEARDPECDLDYIPNVARAAQVRHVLSNSFGFGGQNVSLIVSKFE